ncbi:uroporphyrinogen-III synthase [Variovorax sp. OV329]|uniref:uroporphyrinogen-III synthase n=1 Tax=Variovorax sp. OV329 TaxID=1882825 RepID=UPI0008F00AB3|nr:uroporphyrinogen-III synthase [Variovorax sp. OV329]SFM09782.1 uroporphyrinogen-III synthase [Variovorax sp. OV329]
MTGRRVLVTRPAREARRWVDALRQRGLDAHALPLLAIEPLGDDAALRATRARADLFDAWMFVSAAAVEHFLVSPQPAEGPRCWATGPGTASALEAAGVPLSRIDVPGPQSNQFDSESLWRIVQPQVHAGTRVLFVRGADAGGQPAGRDWLSRQVAEAGAEQEALAAYRRVPPAWSEDDRRTAMAAATDGSLWLFSSSQAIANLREALPQADWSGAFAVATHPRIAQAAQVAGFGRVFHSSAQFDAVVASIESFQ